MKPLAAAIITSILTLGMCGCANGQNAIKPMKNDSTSERIEIINSGSTNTAGFHALVDRDGWVEYFATRRMQPGEKNMMRTKIEPQLSARLFHDVESAGDLNLLPATHCMKSASFGYTLTVKYRGLVSPDLSCPEIDPKLAPVLADINEIVSKLSLNKRAPISTEIQPLD